MIRRLWPITVLLLLAGAVIWRQVAAERAGAAWLTRAAAAERTLAYDAEGVTEAGGVRATFRLRQRDGGYTLTYTDPAHAGTVLTSTNGTVTLTATDMRVQQAGTSAAPLTALLAQHYVATATRRHGTLVDLLVRRHRWSRPVLALTINTATDIPVARTRYDAEGKVIQHTALTRLTVSGTRTCCAEQSVPSLPAAEAQARFTWWAPRWLPAGFALTGYRVTPCACGCGDQVLQATYSDGLRALAVFQSEMGDHGCGAGDACGAGQQGSCVGSRFADVHMVGRTVGARTIAVMGDLDDRTLTRVARSITPQ
jgi:negative regulator of sigma E activity